MTSGTAFGGRALRLGNGAGEFCRARPGGRGRGSRCSLTRSKPSGPGRLANALVFVLSILSALVFWELLSRTGAISERDLPSMSSAVGELWTMAQTSHFWSAFGYTARGWAVGLALASVLAIPLGVALGLSDLGASAFRVPIEFLRPIPSAALIPLLFLTLGTNFKSEVFLATFGAFWPILVQTMYGVRDVDPVTSDTARSFGVPPPERLWRITLPSSVPYILDRDADRLLGGADPRVHRGAVHGNARAGKGAQLRAVVRSHDPAVRAGPRDRDPRPRHPPRIHGVRASPVAVASVAAGRNHEPAHLQGAQDRGRDRRSGCDRRGLAGVGRVGRQQVLPAAADDLRGVPGSLALLAVRHTRRSEPGANPARLRDRVRSRDRARDPARPVGLVAQVRDAPHRVLARDATAGAAADLGHSAALDRESPEGVADRVLLLLPRPAQHDGRSSGDRPHR